MIVNAYPPHLSQYFYSFCHPTFLYLCILPFNELDIKYGVDGQTKTISELIPLIILIFKLNSLCIPFSPLKGRFLIQRRSFDVFYLISCLS